MKTPSNVFSIFAWMAGYKVVTAQVNKISENHQNQQF